MGYSKWQVAIHEAGHAVMCRLVGIAVEYAFVRDCQEEDDYDYTFFGFEGPYGQVSPSDTPYDPVKDALITVAGQVASTLVGVKDHVRTISSDLAAIARDKRNIAAIAGPVAWSQQTHTAFTTWIKSWALDLLTPHQDSIRILAQALDDRGRLEGEEIERLIGPKINRVNVLAAKGRTAMDRSIVKGMIRAHQQATGQYPSFAALLEATRIGTGRLNKAITTLERRREYVEPASQTKSPINHFFNFHGGPTVAGFNYSKPASRGYQQTNEQKMLEAMEKLSRGRCDTNTHLSNPVTDRELIDAAGLGTATGQATLDLLIEDNKIERGFFGLAKFAKHGKIKFPKTAEEKAKAKGSKKAKPKAEARS